LLVRMYWEQKNKWRSHWFLNWLKPPPLKGCRSRATAILLKGCRSRATAIPPTQGMPEQSDGHLTQGMPEQSDGNPPLQRMPEQSDGHPQIKRPPNGWPINSNAIKSYC
jgi:hypothetical protein